MYARIISCLTLLATLILTPTVAHADIFDTGTPFGTTPWGKTYKPAPHPEGTQIVSGRYRNGFINEYNRQRALRGLPKVPSNRIITDRAYSRYGYNTVGQKTYIKQCLKDVMTYHKTRKRYIHVEGHCNAPVMYWNYNVPRTDKAAARAWWNSYAHRKIIYKPHDYTRWWEKGGTYGQCLSVTFVRAHRAYTPGNEPPMSHLAVAHWRPCEWRIR